jgi:hypothetical protein
VGLKGIALTLDAVLSSLIMITIISLLIFFRIESSSPFFTSQQLHSLSEDSLTILSQSTFRELANKTILDNPILFNTYYNQSGSIGQSDFDKKVIDVLGMLWAENDANASLAAANITKDVLGDILPENIGYQVLINDNNIYNSSDTSRPSESGAEAGISAGRIASGYESNKTVSGCVAMAYITSIKSKKDSSYVYFGGYVGDGNITTNITLPPFDHILEAYMELDVGSNFTLYINSNYLGNYSNGTAGGGLMRADKWVICKDSNYNPYYEPDVNISNTSCSNFIVGNNTLKFNFTGNNSFIGGGYFRITYNTTQLAPQKEVGKDTYWFPGISGFFNLYDSFYVPGTLNNTTTYLHYFNNVTINQTNASVYLSIGSVEVFRNNNTGEQKISLNYSDIWQKFGSNVSLIGNVSNRTVPLRFGIEAFQVKPGVGIADAVLITDVSGSMDTYDVQPGNQQRLAVAKSVDNVFVDTVLNTSGNRVGLVSYSTSVSRTHPLSNNSVTLKGNISLYQPLLYTCISCGIDNATKMLDNVTESRFKGLLVMSDGNANRCLLGTDCGIYGQSEEYSDSTSPDYPPKLEAINMSCVARSKNYTIFSVGFGTAGTSNGPDNITLQRIACWNCSACRLDCNQFYTQQVCPSECFWNSTAPTNYTIFSDGFEVDITTNWTVSSNWTRIANEGYLNSYAAKKGTSSGSGNLTTKSVNTSDATAIYVDFWYRDDDTDANEVRLEFNNSSGSWNSIADLSSTTPEDRWHNYVIKITNSQYFHSGFAVRFRGSTFGSGENFWIDDVSIDKTSIGGCENKNNFSSSSPCWIALPDGSQTACTNVRYAQSNDVDELTNIYQGFGQWFVNLGYTTQKANITGNISYSNILYPDSHIDFSYNNTIIPYQYGEISLNIEAPRLKNLTGDNISKPYKEGWFNVSDKVNKVVDAKITSYSSDYWTDMLWINSSITTSWKEAYNLTFYGNDYTTLGDPFIIYMPINDISPGNNSVRIETGFPFNNTINKTGGSPDDRVIYTARVKGSVGYGDLKGTCEDAINDAYYRLNDSIGGYVSFTNDEVEFQNNSITKVPYMWGPANIRISVWS